MHANSTYQQAVFSVTWRKKKIQRASCSRHGTTVLFSNNCTARCCASMWTTMMLIKCTSWFERLLCVARNWATSSSRSASNRIVERCTFSPISKLFARCRLLLVQLNQTQFCLRAATAQPADASVKHKECRSKCPKHSDLPRSTTWDKWTSL